MPLHPKLTSGYGVSVQYIYTNTQIDFYTQRLTREKKIENLLWLLKNTEQ